VSFIAIRDTRSGVAREFESAEVRLGRDPECEWILDGEGAEVVSGHHARLVHRDGHWWVEDVGSRNGTTLDGVPISHGQPHAVVPGSVIGLGERGPRLRVDAIEKRKTPKTVIEPLRAVRPSAPTMPMTSLEDATLPMQGLSVREESTPASPAAGQGAPAPPPPPPPPPSPPPPPPPSPPAVWIAVRDTRTDDRHEAKGGRVRVGRGDECDLRPVQTGDTSVSRVHAEIVWLPEGQLIVRDAQSRNGTYLNGERLTGDRPLALGDRITLGEGGPDLLVESLTLPGGERQDFGKKTDAPRSPAAVAGKPGPAARRSFAGKGKTVFFREMMEESTKKSASRLRTVVWSFVAVLLVAAGAFFWYDARRAEETRQQLLARQAVDDSIRRVAAVEYDRLRQQLDHARASSASGPVLDSLRRALTAASQKTEALETALRRAEASMAQQLAAGDSVRRAAREELRRLQADMARAGTSGAMLDSLRTALRLAEDRARAVDAQLRAVRGVNLPALSQSAGGAVGLVTTFATDGVYDGSGFVITQSGYFITNRHVAQPGPTPADSFFVTMADQQYPVRADLFSIAPPNGPDLAVLRIRNYRGPVVPRVDWSGTNVRQGEAAALIGFPAGAALALDASGKVQTSMSAGIFSKVSSDRIQFDGFTVGGSSGSPIFNADGEVAAVHRAGLKEAAGLGFAVPIAQLVPYLPADARAELGLR
jgi:pSer/pThr/pTyr-binding forkhead associated (FHA) protein/S1-C subfamily serine protease